MNAPTPGPYDGMAAAVDDAGEDWVGITAESGAHAHVTVYRGATLLSVHDPKNNTTTVVRLSAAHADILAEDLAACAGDPAMSPDTETDGGWMP